MILAELHSAVRPYNAPMNEAGNDPEANPEVPQPKPRFGTCLVMLGICLFLVWAVLSLGGTGGADYWIASKIFPWVAALSAGILAAILIVGMRRKD